MAVDALHNIFSLCILDARKRRRDTHTSAQADLFCCVGVGVESWIVDA